MSLITWDPSIADSKRWFCYTTLARSSCILLLFTTENLEILSSMFVRCSVIARRNRANNKATIWLTIEKPCI